VCLSLSASSPLVLISLIMQYSQSRSGRLLRSFVRERG